MYKSLLQPSPAVPWNVIVWNCSGIPRHSFFCGLVTLNRCPTCDRMLNWGLSIPPQCLLCNNNLESRDHLFFVCSFSWTVWRSISIRCQIPPLRDWSSSLTALVILSVSSIHRRMILLGWQSSIYYLWAERNGRLHRNILRSLDQILRLVDNTIRNWIAAIRYHNPRASSQKCLLLGWNTHRRFHCWD